MIYNVSVVRSSKLSGNTDIGVDWFITFYSPGGNVPQLTVYSQS